MAQRRYQTEEDVENATATKHIRLQAMVNLLDPVPSVFLTFGL